MMEVAQRFDRVVRLHVPFVTAASSENVSLNGYKLVWESQLPQDVVSKLVKDVQKLTSKQSVHDETKKLIAAGLFVLVQDGAYILADTIQLLKLDPSKGVQDGVPPRLRLYVDLNPEEDQGAFKALTVLKQRWSTGQYDETKGKFLFGYELLDRA
ncbi:hypothetical protein BDQ12DRAFT_665647 [Crucibulum laeve]|uniref:Uncharacterized protein n=1 Tax=Crucibulum laeve TaxID=68775 RepID=A0A5C3M438_9AGAR|nr:hypothetical protein BDQ12DRAFT_665647 [Crucibulum laeve]